MKNEIIEQLNELPNDHPIQVDEKKYKTTGLWVNDSVDFHGYRVVIDDKGGEFLMSFDQEVTTIPVPDNYDAVTSDDIVEIYEIPVYPEYGKVQQFKRVERDFREDYRLLSIMKRDNDYYLKTPHEKHLYTGSVDEQIKEMKKLWLKLPEKPEWLSWKKILDYESKMVNPFSDVEMSQRKEKKPSSLKNSI